MYLQIILPQVLVFLAIFILIKDGWDFGPLWFWIRLVQLEAAIKGAGGGGLQADSLHEWSPQTLVRLAENTSRYQIVSSLFSSRTNWPDQSASMPRCCLHLEKHWNENRQSSKMNLICSAEYMTSMWLVKVVRGTYLRGWGGGLGLLPELPEWLRNLQRATDAFADSSECCSCESTCECGHDLVTAGLWPRGFPGSTSKGLMTCRHRGVYGTQFKLKADVPCEVGHSQMERFIKTKQTNNVRQCS